MPPKFLRKVIDRCSFYYSVLLNADVSVLDRLGSRILQIDLQRMQGYQILKSPL